MAWVPKIEYNPAMSVEDNLRAMANWLNFTVREMSAGRVPALQTGQTEAAARAAEQSDALDALLIQTLGGGVVDG